MCLEFVSPAIAEISTSPRGRKPAVRVRDEPVTGQRLERAFVVRRCIAPVMVTIINQNDVIVKRYGSFILGKGAQSRQEIKVCGAQHETRALWLDFASVAKEMDRHEIQP